MAHTLAAMSESSPQDIYRQLIDALAHHGHERDGARAAPVGRSQLRGLEVVAETPWHSAGDSRAHPALKRME
jgi:hypothetical protein